MLEFDILHLVWEWTLFFIASLSLLLLIAYVSYQQQAEWEYLHHGSMMQAISGEYV